ncbi:MAG: hypothetical protein AAF456_02240 [Planctomycetota bacterium]
MSTTGKDLADVAARHGVNIADVAPPSREAKLNRLKQILDDTSVPFPIAPEKAARYLAAFENNEPFRIGDLGETSVDLREYSNEQVYENYSLEEHLSWACLIADQDITKQKYACREYLEGEAMFEIGDAFIPDYYLLNARIYQQTSWQLATVNMIIPAELFFTCHSLRFFPVTTFMRPLGTDYLEEPDIGHDVAGHVATFTIPAVAQVMVNHGLARDMIYHERDEQLIGVSDESEIGLINQRAEELLLYAGRIYWFTVEFGLVMQDGEVRDFGAGILSSPGETEYSISSPLSNRVLIDPSSDHDLIRLATTDYLISEFQKTYFVMESFDLLESLTPERIFNAAKLAVELPHYTWREVAPGDDTINVGTVVTSPNEKYLRLMTAQPIDECLTRTAERNLRMYSDGIDTQLLEHFKAPPPEVPAEIIEWFRSR